MVTPFLGLTSIFAQAIAQNDEQRFKDILNGSPLTAVEQTAFSALIEQVSKDPSSLSTLIGNVSTMLGK